MDLQYNHHDICSLECDLKHYNRHQYHKIPDMDLDIFLEYMPNYLGNHCSTHIPVCNLVDCQNIEISKNTMELHRYLCTRNMNRMVMERMDLCN